MRPSYMRIPAPKGQAEGQLHVRLVPDQGG